MLKQCIVKECEENELVSVNDTYAAEWCLFTILATNWGSPVMSQ